LAQDGGEVEVVDGAEVVVDGLAVFVEERREA